MWVLVGHAGESVKVFGPFDDADEARAYCNALTIPGVSWDVVPLMAAQK